MTDPTLEQPEFIVIIPARYYSTRLPGKPLALIDNKPMVQWVYERSQASGAQRVIVATDDQRVFDAVLAFNGEVCMTKKTHESGTERLAEVINTYDFSDDAIIVNVQGDEPMIPASNIKQLAKNLSGLSGCKMATLAESISTRKELNNPNVVKVVTDKNNFALTFSRAAVPFQRDAATLDKESEQVQHVYPFLRHIGIYAYRAGFIKEYVSWPASQLEQVESLEQLRVLWQGEKIHVDLAVEPPPAGVDTPEDLEQVRRLVACLKQQ